TRRVPGALRRSATTAAAALAGHGTARTPRSERARQDGVRGRTTRTLRRRRAGTAEVRAASPRPPRRRLRPRGRRGGRRPPGWSDRPSRPPGQEDAGRAAKLVEELCGPGRVRTHLDREFDLVRLR